MRRRRKDSLARDLLKGAAAGAVATWVMGRVSTFMYERENPAARRLEDQARGNRTAYEAAAEKGASAVGERLSADQRARFGDAIHWTLGIGAGAVYAALRRRFDTVGRAAGLAFGTAFWAVVDEGVVPLLGLTPGPKAFPWQTHARGLGSHLTFGAVVDRTLRVLDAVA